MSRRRKLFAELYQAAGELLLAPDVLTEGQRARLTELVLDVLSEPDRYKARVLGDLRRMAKRP